MTDRTLTIKICGITREEDAACALDCGADCLGFVLYPKSPRFVPPERLAALTRDLPRHIVRVGVAVNADPGFLREAIDAGGLQVVQFHGEETAEQLAAFTAAVPWKAVPLGNRGDLDTAASFGTEMIVVDAAGAGARGGTGRRCNWNLAAELASARPILLAGGLDPENVADAVRIVRPAGVDVSSGVESAPGCKDHNRIRAFVNAARTALNHTHGTRKHA